MTHINERGADTPYNSSSNPNEGFLKGLEIIKKLQLPESELEANLPEWEKEPIEKAYPEAYRLARMFHDLYEEVAPRFGYKTRGDTKAFDPSSPNGRTMAYVCKTIVDEEVEKTLTSHTQSLIQELEGMKNHYEMMEMEGKLYTQGFEQAIDHAIEAVKQKQHE